MSLTKTIFQVAILFAVASFTAQAQAQCGSHSVSPARYYSAPAMTPLTSTYRAPYSTGQYLQGNANYNVQNFVSSPTYTSYPSPAASYRMSVQQPAFYQNQIQTVAPQRLVAPQAQNVVLRTNPVTRTSPASRPGSSCANGSCPLSGY